MADMLASGVWRRDGCGDIPEALPISPELVAAIEAWQCWYNAEDSRHEAGTDWEAGDDWDREGFASQGRALARQMKAELPDWTVIYYDVAAVHRHGGTRARSPRHLWEYEIKEEKVDPGSSPG